MISAVTRKPVNGVTCRDVFRWTLLWAFLFCTCVTGRAVAEEKRPIWNPQTTWVFVVGLLEWQRPDLWSPFPGLKLNRCDEQLAAHFRRSKVPSERIVYLQDAKATKERVIEEFGRLLDQTRQNDLLVFYFCGHGSRKARTEVTCFATYDAGDEYRSAWSVHEIVSQIERRFHGRQALLLADCCHSGGLYDEALKQHKSRIAYNVLTSSYSHNSSTGRWTFSESVLAGLRGDSAVDLDHDGHVTLGETAKYAESELAFVDGQKSMFLTSSGFPAETVLAAAKPPAAPHQCERIEVEWKGKWYKAKTLAANGAQRKVRYVQYDSSWDEWIGPERRRAYQPAQFAVGDRVQVRWDQDGEWYPATVRDSWYGLHFVRYDGYDAAADEWIGPGSIRLRDN